MLPSNGGGYEIYYMNIGSFGQFLKNGRGKFNKNIYWKV